MNIVDRVRARIRFAELNGVATEKFRPLHVATALDIAADEQTLGFKLPPLLKRLYQEIGNGGWGPGYGLLGLTGGMADDTGRNAIEGYTLSRSWHPSDPDWQWPAGMLGICHWGCAIYSCVDCLSADFPVILFDPNVHKDGNDWTDALFPECSSFEQWIKLWADGVDLWERLYADDGLVAAEVEARASGPDGGTHGSSGFCR